MEDLETRADLPIDIDPTVDFAFKRVFGSPDNPEITIHLLNAILRNHKIDSVEFLSPMIEKEYAEDKLSVLDLQLRADGFMSINVEMQTTVPFSLGERLAYYVATMYSRQLSEGMSYGELRDTMTICILTQNLFPGALPAHQVFRLVSQDNLLLTDTIQVHTIELAKHVPIVDNWEQATDLEKWCEFLTRVPLMTVSQVAETFRDPVFIRAAEILAMIAKNPSERALYDARLKAKRDEEWIVKGSQLAVEKAQREAEKAQREAEKAQREAEKGREEGRVEGREEGRVEGIQVGQLIGRILVLQEFLGENSPAQEQLKAMDEPSLRALAEQLEIRLRK